MTGDDLVLTTRAWIEVRGAGSLAVSRLTSDDIPHIGWSGTPTHVRNVEAQLLRIYAGEAEYLAVRSPAGVPVAKGGIDFSLFRRVGVIWQLATHPQLQSLGIGSHLIAHLEKEIAHREMPEARLSVETDNTRALELYERLGYRAIGTSTTSWEAERPDGTVYTYTAKLIDMAKALV